jgi:D-glycero-D-manno-heptose 1,7-bisphosphate phosphatase
MPAIMLDRDGVINVDSVHFIRRLEEWEPIPGSIEAIARLSRAGWTVAVCTNQSGLARGYFDRDTLDTMHEKLRGLVRACGGEVHGIYVCPHGPDENCDCRKPRTGLLVQAAAELGFSLPGTPFIGDSASDLQAAVSARARPILVLTGKGSQTLATNPQVEHYNDLSDAAEMLLSEQQAAR